MRIAASRSTRFIWRRNFSASSITINDISIDANAPDLHARACAAFRDYGCFVVRGLGSKYVDSISQSVAETARQAMIFERDGHVEKIKEGWMTPDGSLFTPAAWDGTKFAENREKVTIDLVEADTLSSDDKEDGLPLAAYHEDGSVRHKQIMVLGMDYMTCSALFRCACDERTVDLVCAIFKDADALGDDGVELFGNGQLVYKEPSGGHVVNFHQDAAFFEFEGVGPIGTLNYAIDTELGSVNNGPLYVLPGSHKRGYIDHIDTSSHLGLPGDAYNTESPGMIAIEGKAGDSIFFHQFCVHGSPPNHSNLPRPTFINRYTRPSDRVKVPLATTVEMRKTVIEEAKTTPSERERGIMLRGNRRPNPDASFSKKQFH